MSNIDDTLSLPDEVEVRLLSPNMMVLRNVIPAWRDELIQITQKLSCWKHSGQILPNGTQSYKGTHRTSRSLMLSSSHLDYGACFRRFEEGVYKAFLTGVSAYKQYNRFLDVTHDSGFEMLRYEEGQHFGMHTDAILGRHEGLRQLSALIYLNDDYEGGETYFPRQQIKFKAKAGDLLLFPSTFCYPHEALPVTKGVKYAIVTWFIAYPKVQEDSVEEEQHGEAEVDGDSGRAAPDDGMRLHESPGSGSPTGEPEASDREHSTSAGRLVEQGSEA